ncbi:MAG TPA: DivIVA domain-containing protein [Micromonosporaceae bacterium]|nr:DivIVA domain-containing protein [Micromonosporaceae bacterium]
MNAPTATPTPRQRLHAFHARAVSRLNPATIRTREFPTKRRGLNPDDVKMFLAEVAGEIAALHRELAIVQQENDRLKTALRDWQTQQATRIAHTLATAGNIRPRQVWPINQTKPA